MIAPTSDLPPPLATCRTCSSVLDPGSHFCQACGATSASSQCPDPLVGRVVGDRYRILEQIGRGGMGVVYRAEHVRMGKIMAVKLLHGDLARDPAVQRRFRREAEAASRLSHPSTVSIFDFGTSDGLMYLVMEYVAGEDLGRLLRSQGPLPFERAAVLVAQACGSIAEAHELGVVHRDLKPENLLVTRLRDGRELVKLLDFGLAKLRDGEDRNEITGAGTLVGTPYYMAPEIIRGGPGDHRVDIYALGAVLYRVTVGLPPFAGSSPMAVLTKHLTERLVPPSRRRPDLHLPPLLDEIVLRAMARDPDERYPRIEEIRKLLVDHLAEHGLSDSVAGDSSGTRTARRRVVRPEDRPAPEIATRGDVDDFERRLRRSRLAAGSGLAAALLAGTAFGGWSLQSKVGDVIAPRDAELEPNNNRSTATPIGPGLEVHGYLGRRLARDRGDHDVFRLAPIPPGVHRLRVEVSPPPNIDAVLELSVQDESRPAAVADAAGVGGREALPNFRVTGRTYFVTVHERLRDFALPVENVSDAYTLRYVLEPAVATEELEPDDISAGANVLRANTTCHGFVDRVDDVDLWCLDAQLTPLRVTLAAPRNLDLELQVRPRDGTMNDVRDGAPAGAEETLLLPPPRAGAPPACIAVRGSSLRPITQGDTELGYTLRAEPP